MKLAVFTFIALALAGCSSTTTSNPVTDGSGAAAAAQVKGKQFEFAEFKITIPESMVGFDLSSPTLEADVIKAFGAEKGKSTAGLLKSMGGGGAIKLFAYSKAGLNEAFAENINVIVMDAPAGIDRAKYLSENERQLTAMKISDIKKDTVKLGKHEYDRLSYTLPGMNFSTTSYLLLSGGKAHTITVSALKSASPFIKTAETAISTYEPK